MLDIDIPISLHAKVNCLDGACGKVSQIIVNPVMQTVTHLVVQDQDFENSDQRLVALDHIISVDPKLITLGCSKADVAAMEPFTKTHYIETQVTDYSIRDIENFGLSADPSPIMSWPYATPTTTEYVPVEDEQIPPGEINVRRGALVEAMDGEVGKVDEFLLESNTGHITHLVLREGHLWATKEIAIPLKAIARMAGDLVLLKLNKREVADLPPIPIHRNY